MEGPGPTALPLLLPPGMGATAARASAGGNRRPWEGPRGLSWGTPPRYGPAAGAAAPWAAATAARASAGSSSVRSASCALSFEITHPR